MDSRTIRPRKDIRLAGAGNPTVTTTARLKEKYQNETSGEVFTCVSIDDFGWGNTYKWAGSQGTIIDNDILSDSNANLVAMYTMDNISGSTLVDESPNNFDLRYINASATPGLIGNATDFDGSTTEIGSGDPIHSQPELLNATNPFSIVLWVNPDTLTGPHVLFSQYWSADFVGTGRFFVKLLGTGVMRWLYGTGNTTSVKDDTTATVSTGSYQMVYIERNTTTEQLGISVNNGALETFSFPNSYSIQQVGSALGFIDAQSGPNEFLDGKQDHVRVFNRIATAAERTALYNEGAI